jgi:hypothetical protein
MKNKGIRSIPQHSLFKDLTGQQFGRLTVIALSDRKCWRKSFWICKCECGNEKAVRGDSLVCGAIRSCGCLKREAEVINFGIENNHKRSGHPLYKRWNAMIQRCENPNTIAYKNYGERGIRVCDEWHDIERFIEWSEKSGFKPELTIDRINVNGDYEPNNCRWITMQEQAFNKTDSVFHTWNGETLTTMQWVHRYNIPLAKAWGYRKNGVNFTDLIQEYATKTTPR